MFALTLQLSDDLTTKLIQAASQTNKTVEKFAVDVLTDHVQAEKDAPADVLWEATAMSRECATFKKRGEQFLLEDVVEPTTWSLLSPGQRKQLGKKFRQMVESEGIAKFVGRRPDRHAVYERV